MSAAHPRLYRTTVIPKPARRLVWSIFVVGITVIVVSLVQLGEAVTKELGDSCPRCDERNVEAYVFDAYPQWRHAHAESCPASIDELSPYIGGREARDRWGLPFEMTCDAQHIVVHTVGEDRLPNTADDFWRSFP